MNSPTTLKKRIVRLLEKNATSRRIPQVWDDWLTLLSTTYRAPVMPMSKEDVDAWDRAYTKYDEAELGRFEEAHELLVQAFQLEPGDHLGEIYMSLPHGGEGMGQFFTPYDLSKTLAGMTAPDLAEWAESGRILTVHEPSVGAGGMVIAFAEIAREQGVNYQRQVLVDCGDIDMTAVQMAFIQLSILGIPALVRHMNTLTLEQWAVWPTLFYAPVAQRLKEQRNHDRVLALLRGETPIGETERGEPETTPTEPLPDVDLSGPHEQTALFDLGGAA